MVAPAAQRLFLELAGRGALGDRRVASWLTGSGYARTHTSRPPLDHAALEVDVQLHQVVAALQEVVP